MASRSLGTLTLDVVAKIGGFEKGMDAAARTSEKRLKQIQATAKKVGLAIGAAIGTGVIGLGFLVKGAIDAADEMSKLSQSAGVSIGALSQLQYAAGLSGVEDLSGDLTKFNRNISEAAQGTEAQAEAFESLGISIKNSDGALKDTETLFNEVAQAFSGIEDGATKTAVAMELFGRSGAALIPLLNSGKAGIEQMREEADALGLTLDERTGKASEEFNDNLSRLTSVASGLGVRLASDLAPELARLTGLLVNASNEANSVSRAADGLRVFFGVLVVPVVTLSNALQIVGESFAAVGAAISAISSGDLSRLDAIGEAFGEDRRQNIQDIKNAYNAFFGDVQSGAEETAKALDSASVRSVLELPTASGVGGVDKAIKDSERQADAIQKTIDALKEESATYGLNRAQIEARRIAQMGATEAQVQQVFELSKYIEQQEEANRIQEEGKALAESIRSPLENYQAGIENLNELLAAGAITQETYNRAVFGLQEAFDQATTGFEKVGESALDTGETLSTFADQAARNMQDAFADFLFDPFDQGLKGMIRSFADTLQRMAAEAAAQQIFGALMSGGSGGFLDFILGLGGGLGGSTPIGGARAMGGPVSPGKAYLVGEQGPEWMVPSGAGAIIPNGGGMTVNQSFVINAPSGSVSKATQLQIAAQASKGAARGSIRNN